jgi:hypothetical protein
MLYLTNLGRPIVFGLFSQIEPALSYFHYARPVLVEGHTLRDLQALGGLSAVFRRYILIAWHQTA